MLGGTTALAIGVGVAVGGGIFRTPGGIALELGSPGWIIAAWICGGLYTLGAGLVTAELATRFPEAGGEYVFWREAYGEFMAFFFGWSYTIFIIGCGAAAIAVPLGEVSCVLLGISSSWTPWIGIGATIAVTATNCAGLRVGADTQNVLSFLKVGALLAIIGLAFWHGPAAVENPPAAITTPSGWGLWLAFFVAFRQVLWCYDGTTDSVKMAEEIHDVKRSLTRALIGASVLLTVVYVVLNVAIMHVLPPAVMARSQFVANDVLMAIMGVPGRRLTAGLTALVCLGALASTTLATVRVTYALARDRLAFGALGRMSATQSPVAALIAVGVLAVAFILSGGFNEVLSVYSFTAAILFSLSYASLLVFRARDRAPRPDIFRCPGGVMVAILLIVVQAGVAFGAAYSYPRGAVWSGAIFAAIAVMYAFWKRIHAAACVDNHVRRS